MAYPDYSQKYLFDRATNVNNVNINAKVMKLIGEGIKYPFNFSNIDGTISVVEPSKGLMKINGSIHHILSTSVGSRFFNPEFGSKLPSLVFEPYDQILKDQIFMYTVEALRRWEKRIKIKGIWFDDTYMEQSQMGVGIAYEIINTQVSGNYVYNFYLRTEPVP